MIRFWRITQKQILLWVFVGPVESGRTSVSSSTITLRGNEVSTESRTETWAISKPINLEIFEGE